MIECSTVATLAGQALALDLGLPQPPSSGEQSKVIR